MSPKNIDAAVSIAVDDNKLEPLFLVSHRSLVVVFPIEPTHEKPLKSKNSYEHDDTRCEGLLI